jgi:hypothetical protein
LIGGTLNPNFSINSEDKDLPKKGLLKVDLSSKTIADELEMPYRANHVSSCATSDFIIFAGGELNGQWLKSFFYYDIRNKHFIKKISLYKLKFHLLYINLANYKTI